MSSKKDERSKKYEIQVVHSTPNTGLSKEEIEQCYQDLQDLNDAASAFFESLYSLVIKFVYARSSTAAIYYPTAIRDSHVQRNQERTPLPAHFAQHRTISEYYTGKHSYDD
ncbi:hypothetical protein [Brevibacillus agri]|uniref:hypothetical protein n=1 Tax=Brevibacillus agri TaxID=51101 RepID=UPI002E248FED|nr:hypothetical protein [Brevibacillus agri]